MSIVVNHADSGPSITSLPLDIDESLWGNKRDVFEADIAIIGLGYVGLPTALAFHAAGRSVVGIDIDPTRLAAISASTADLLETDHLRLKTALGDERFSVSADVSTLTRAAAVIVCVPTPVDAHLVPDLSILRAACAELVQHAVPGQLLILTSTSYVGSTYDMLVEPLVARGLLPGQDIFIAFSPERIDPGNERHAHEDVPRVVGGVTPRCTERAARELSGYVRTIHRVSSPEAAEMCKLLENTFRAVNIAMINEFADAARVMRLDVMEVISAAATKPFGFMPFTPGPGVGGHCIPCDPHYLLWQMRKMRHSAPLIGQAMTSIAARPHRVTERAAEVLSLSGKPLQGASVLLVGVAYKPDVADLRESPALEIAAALIAAGAQVSYHDRLIPTVRLLDGTQLIGVAVPDSAGFDLVIPLVLHRELEPEVLDRAALILDATYRVPSAPHVTTL